MLNYDSMNAKYNNRVNSLFHNFDQVVKCEAVSNQT